MEHQAVTECSDLHVSVTTAALVAVPKGVLKVGDRNYCKHS